MIKKHYYRSIRGYHHKDFSYLLKNPKPKSKTSIIEDTLQPVTPEYRIRCSKMDDKKMIYAYSKRKKIWHDRDCDLVREIPDTQFEMSDTLNLNAKTCQKCYRMMLLRKSIGDDGKRISAYMRFFDDISASNKDLKLLLIDNNAKIRWMNRNELYVKCHDDSWIIKITPNKTKLLHNNYIILSDNSRYMQNEYHEQHLVNDSFNELIGVIINYSWSKHKKFLEKTQRNTIAEK